MSKRYVVGLLGNPNCGKTTLFNALTGSRQRVGNWPGVTVERKVGHFNLGDLAIELIDLRGTYSLEVGDDAVSLDERVPRDFIAECGADLVINIVDAANLARTLFPGWVTPFVMELPRYRLPTPPGVLTHASRRAHPRLGAHARVRGERWPHHRAAGAPPQRAEQRGPCWQLRQRSDRSLLSDVGRAITPVFGPFGVSDENWPASVGIFTGFLAKEPLVVAALRSAGVRAQPARNPRAVAARVEGAI